MACPPAPAGFDWYIRETAEATVAASLVDDTTARIDETDAASPTDVLAEARRAIIAIDDLRRPRT